MSVIFSKVSFIMRLLILLSILSFIGVSTGQEKGLTLYIYEIASVDLENENGAYTYFIKSFAKKSKVSEVQNVPFRRALIKFKNDRESCLFPVQKEVFDKNSTDFIFSKALSEIDLNIITLKGNKINSFSEVKMKKGVSLTQNRSIASKNDYDLQYISVEKIEQAIGMLLLGRVDYIIAPGWDTYQLNKQKLAFNEKLVVSKIKDLLVCHNTPEGRKSIDLFNKLIQ